MLLFEVYFNGVLISSYLNCLEHGEFEKSVDYLHQYFDHVVEDIRQKLSINNIDGSSCI